MFPPFCRVLAISCLVTSSITLAQGPPGLLDGIGQAIHGLELPLLDSPLPWMITKTPSPECANINRGNRLCCQTTINGDLPLIIELASVLGYRLPKDLINGIYCKKDAECLTGSALCCQVDAFPPQLIPILPNLAMYCQQAPRYIFSGQKS